MYAVLQKWRAEHSSALADSADDSPGLCITRGVPQVWEGCLVARFART